jgi:hypothetical protein
MKDKIELLVTASIFAFLQTALGQTTLNGQTTVKGTVHARRDGNPLRGVSVLAVSGAGTATDSLGQYSIRLAVTDSIYFSWLGKVTDRFAVKNLHPDEPFDINLDEVNVRSLPALLVNGSKDYLQDSLIDRGQYQKVFDYEAKSGLQEKNLNQLGGLGLGWDLNNMFSPSNDSHTQALQQKLLETEQDKYINHKFNRSLVKKISGLEPPLLDSFMKAYRPRAETLQKFETDYEYYQWISDQAKLFREELKLLSALSIMFCRRLY